MKSTTKPELTIIAPAERKSNSAVKKEAPPKVWCDYDTHGSPYFFINKQGISNGEYLNKSLRDFGFENIVAMT